MLKIAILLNRYRIYSRSTAEFGIMPLLALKNNWATKK
jgi:hypothetical protein